MFTILTYNIFKLWGLSLAKSASLPIGWDNS